MPKKVILQRESSLKFFTVKNNKNKISLQFGLLKKYKSSQLAVR